MFYEKNEIEFNLTKKRVSMEIVKGGHQFVELEPLGNMRELFCIYKKLM